MNKTDNLSMKRPVGNKTQIQQDPAVLYNVQCEHSGCYFSKFINKLPVDDNGL